MTNPLLGFVLNLLTPFLIAGGLTDPALARQAAEQAITEIMERKIFGSAGAQIILEECLRGEELSEEQRAVFIAHEMDGRSFKELAAETGLSVNTLLSRKRYAILHLRRRLQAIYEDFMEL